MKTRANSRGRISLPPALLVCLHYIASTRRAVVSLCLVLYVSTQPRPLFLWAFIFNLRFRSFSIRRGRPFALSVFAPSCLCSLNTSGGGVHIVHVVYLRAGCVDAAPAPLSSSFGAFSIRRARAFVLVSYSLNAGRCHIGRRVDAAPPRRAVLRLSGFGLLLHEKDGAGDMSNERANAAHAAKEQHGAASSSPHVGAFASCCTIRRGSYNVAP